MSLVAVAHEVAVPATAAAAVAYQSVSDGFWLAEQLAAPLLAALLLWSGWGARTCAAIKRTSGSRRYVTVAGFAAFFVVMLQLVRAPLDYSWRAAYARASGSAPDSAAAWLAAQAVPSVLLLSLFVTGAVVLYALIQRSPRAWWLFATLAGCVLALALLMGEPLTRSYTALDSQPMARAIEALATRIGVPADRIGVRHSDDMTGCGAATVIGLGPTRLMLLDDTLLQNYPQREVLQSVAHESSHFTRDDNVRALALISAWLFATLALVQFGSRWALWRLSGRFGFESLADPASLPLLVLIASAVSLFLLPFGRAYQQQAVEQRADRFALDITHDNASEAMLYVKDMKCYPLLVSSPSPFYRAFRATHPSIEERIRFADAYHPWKSQSKPR